jgi:hypothetical protein
MKAGNTLLFGPAALELHRRIPPPELSPCFSGFCR